MTEIDERAREISTKGIDVAYLEPQIVNQRLRTLATLQLRTGERAADIGCGNGLLTQRPAVVETDWRGAVFNSSRDDLTRRVLAAWDAAVASPNLPTRLGPLLTECGFGATRVEAIPVLNTNYSQSNFSSGTMEDLAELARDGGAITKEEAVTWIADFKRLGDEGTYFFCLNRFLFSAVRV